MDSNAIIRMKIPFLLPFYLLALVSACSTGSKTNMEKIISAQRAILQADSIIQKQKKGIDFLATGSNPVPWSLEVDFDKMAYFSASDGTKLGILASFKDRVLSPELEIYRTQTDQGLLEIKIRNVQCTNTSNASTSNKTAEVTINQTRYTGCGNYLYDHRLNDVWELEQVNNIVQQPGDYSRGLPVIEFNLQTNIMNGNDGCNNMRSSIEVKGKRIKFAPIIFTRIACKNVTMTKIADDFLSDKLVDYYFENNKLVFYLSDDSRIIFRRKAL